MIVGISFLLSTCKEKETPAIEDEIVVERVTASPGEITIEVNQTREIQVVVTPSGANQNVNWESASTGIATVTAGGIIKGESPGNTTVKVSSVENADKYAEVRVNVVAETILMTGIQFDNESPLTLYSGGETVQLTWQITPESATNREIRWENTNSDVATVSETGLITPLTEGTTTVKIIAVSDATISDEIVVNVVDPVFPVESITLSDSEITIKVGETFSVDADVLPENATNNVITWESDDDLIATVSDEGVITGVSFGNTVIRAISDDNPEIYEEITVHVVIDPLAIINSAKGLWEFSDATNIGKATIGNDLTPVKRDGEDGEITPLDGGKIHVPHSSYLVCNHGIEPTDDDGTVKRFTMLIDYAIPAPLNQWRVFYWAKPGTDTRDGGLYYSGGSYKVGINSYAPTVHTADTWYRLVIHYSGDNTTHIYINGAKELATTPTTSYTDAHRALASEIWFFSDGYVRTGTMYDYPINVSTIAIWDRILSDDEIAALGGVE